MQKRWVFAKALKEVESTQAIALLEEKLQVPELIARLLVRRGIHSYEEAKSFFRPSPGEMPDPFLMKDMNRAVDRLQRAIENKENILIYGDYDVDGTSSVALVYAYLSRFHENIDYYIPDRYAEGYGISTQGIDAAENSDVKLIIALDCGIKSIDKIQYAKEKGIDFIICDHHRPGDELPDAVAVLDPKREDCAYPYKELCGCGVGYKLLQAWTRSTQRDEDILFEYIDLVAVAIAADIVPITGENRIFTYYGLKKINESPAHWVKAILLLSGKTLPLDISNLVFIIAPRINAAGRIDSGKNAVRLLTSQSEKEALECASQIDQNNDERKHLDKEITRHALELIEANEQLKVAKTTVLFHDSWHKGVVGIVASRLTDTYYRPTILLTNNNGKLTGSARSVRDFDVYDAIEACSHLLEQFGGHKYAAGLTLSIENFEAFRDAFEKQVAATIPDELLIPAIEIEEEISFELLRKSKQEELPRFYRILKQFSPFGPGNMNPVFVAKGLKDSGLARCLKDEHLKMSVYQNDKSLQFDAIAFGKGNLLNEILSGKKFDMAFTLEENYWNGKTSLQLMVKDIRITEE